MNDKIFVSYKMSLDEIHSKLNEHYSKVMQGFMSSGIYAIKRQQFIKKLIKGFIIVTLCYSPWLYKAFTSGMNSVLGLLFVLLFMSVTYFIVYLCIDKNFSDVIKSDCICDLLKVFISNDIVKTAEAVSKEEINESGLFPKWDKCTIDDAFIGSYDGIIYKISETLLFVKSVRTLVPVFNGLIIKLKNLPDIKSTVLISTKTEESKMYDNTDYTKIHFLGYSIPVLIFLGIIYFSIFHSILLNIPIIKEFVENVLNPMWVNYRNYMISGVIVFVLILSKIYRDWDVARLQREQQMKNKYKVSTGDINIESLFDIKITNRENGLKFVNKNLTQLILNIKTLFNASKVVLKFYGDSAMLLIETKKDFFELGNLMHAPLNPKVSDSITSQIAGILLFMDYIKSNHKEQ